MWKSQEADKDYTTKVETPTHRPVASNVNEPKQAHEQAVIGRTITVSGEISGDEDVLVQGRVEGKINLEKNTINVGKNGVVEASIVARIVNVDGKVIGDIEGKERVMVSEAGHIEGNIVAPRVILKDGSRFKGSIDMKGREVKSHFSAQPTSTSKPTAKPQQASASAATSAQGATTHKTEQK